MAVMAHIVLGEEVEAKGRLKAIYDINAKDQTFQDGELVLVLKLRRSGG